MNETEELFLDILRDGVRGRKAKNTETYTIQQWAELCRLAEIHQVLPLFAEAVYEVIDVTMREQLVEDAVRETIGQASRSVEFIQLYKYLVDHGLKPLVMKGIICRELYPEPEQRASVDEDLLIEPDETDRYDEVFRSYGLFPEAGTDIHKEHEITYRSPEKNLYIEVHRNLFAPDSAFKDLNTLFEEKKAVSERIYDTDVYTLDPTDHILYMICHAYKHFLYSGVGIRQMCDIALFSEYHKEAIDWQKIYDDCRRYKIDRYAAGVLRLCSNYLGMSYLPGQFRDVEVDEVPMLEDILDGGLYGTSDMDRLHSSTLTMEAVSASQEGRRSNGLRNSLFPSFEYMKQNYTYLEKKPWLLPAAWGQRIHKYLKDRRNSRVDPGKTIEIGRRRIDLLKQYGIID